MQIWENSSSLLEQSRCRVDSRFPYFYVGEYEKLDIPGAAAWSGMVTVKAGRLKFLLPICAHPVTVVVEVHQGRPADLTEGYEDVIECGYRSATGRPAILHWSEDQACLLNSLPHGPGDYRLRYHVREMANQATVGDACGDDAESLIQIWPASLGRHEELRIEGRLGSYWHPYATPGRRAAGPDSTG